MTNPLEFFLIENITNFFIIFARCGACILVSAFSSSPRIPTSFRLGFAVAFSMLLWPKITPQNGIVNDQMLSSLVVIASETMLGFFIGFLSRFYIFMIEMLASAVSVAIGISSVFASLTSEAESLPALATLLSLAIMTLLFVSDLHHEIIRGLAMSYEALPVGEILSSDKIMTKILDVLMVASRSSLRIAMPFMIYAIVMNLAINIIMRFVPQIQISFVLNPLIILLGVGLLCYLSPQIMFISMNNFYNFLRDLL